MTQTLRVADFFKLKTRTQRPGYELSEWFYIIFSFRFSHLWDAESFKGTILRHEGEIQSHGQGRWAYTEHGRTGLTPSSKWTTILYSTEDWSFWRKNSCGPKIVLLLSFLWLCLLSECKAKRSCETILIFPSNHKLRYACMVVWPGVAGLCGILTMESNCLDQKIVAKTVLGIFPLSWIIDTASVSLYRPYLTHLDTDQ